MPESVELQFAQLLQAAFAQEQMGLLHAGKRFRRLLLEEQAGAAGVLAQESRGVQSRIQLELTCSRVHGSAMAKSTSRLPVYARRPCASSTLSIISTSL